MALENRKVTCDICNASQTEKAYGDGWQDWTIIKGIGAEAPDSSKPVEMKHMEMYICSKHKESLAQFLTDMQEAERVFTKFGRT